MFKTLNAQTTRPADKHLTGAGIVLLAASCLYATTIMLNSGKLEYDLLFAAVWLLPLALVALTVALLRQGRLPHARFSARLATLGCMATSVAGLLWAASSYWIYQSSLPCDRPPLTSSALAAPSCHILAHAGWLLAGLSLAAGLTLAATLLMWRSLRLLRGNTRGRAHDIRRTSG
ncbi:MAG TPA: hypothetical protein VIJ28_03520 [Chloroflexota bacterium]